ncbi:MAG: universal stress protein [Polyangiaceae bacterium]|nr:universal stress protein [Polyangiaceae bacterium]
MTSPSQLPSRTVIVAAIDGTEASDDVLRSAALHAQTRSGAEIHLVHVVEAPSPTMIAELLENARTVVDRSTESVKKHFQGRVASHIATGAPWQEIVQLATNLEADLIVVGANNKRGFEHWLLGSVSDQVVRKANCEVLVARPKGNRNVPEIEPPCPECVATQKASAGQSLWCARHDHRRVHARGHLHYETPPTFAIGSMFIRPGD